MEDRCQECSEKRSAKMVRHDKRDTVGLGALLFMLAPLVPGGVKTPSLFWTDPVEAKCSA